MPGNTRPVGKRGVVSDFTVAAPEYRAGDRLYFSTGRSWTLNVVQKSALGWSDDRGRQWLGGRAQFLPDLKKADAGTTVQREIRGNPEAIWPLAVGNTLYYRVINQTLGSRGQLLSRSLSDWRCRVDEPLWLELVSGTFRTLPLACERSSELGRFQRRQTWYYSDNPGLPVRMLEQRPGREDRAWQLLAYVPRLDLDPGEYRDLTARFQQTMERVASGETRDWQASSGTLRVRITPLATLRQRGGTYCRQYQQRIEQPGAPVRWGAGIVCRDTDRRWKVPNRIDDGQVRFSAGGEPI